MKTTNINLLDAHLYSRDLTFVAQDLLALDVAEKIAQIFGTSTSFIEEARALFARFENEIDAKFASDARLLADHLKTAEGMGDEMTFSDVARSASSLRFPEAPVSEEAPEAPEAPVVEEAPEAPVSELKKRTFVVEIDGQVVAVRETASKEYLVAMGFKWGQSWRINSFHANTELALSYYGKDLQTSTNWEVLPTREIFTKEELKSAKASAKAYKKS
jgi:hypothetical protein